MAASSEGVLPHREIPLGIGGSPSIAAGAPHVIHELQLEHRHAQQEVSQLQDHIMQLANLSSLLGELPDKTQHNVMVPFGPMAFFPGRLIHSNEVLVRLGAPCSPRTAAHDAEKHHSSFLAGQDTVVERSAKQTQQLLARRSKVLEAQSQDAQQQQAALERRLTMAHAMLPEATAGQRPGVGSEAEINIREELEEQGSVNLRVPAVQEKRPDGGPGPGQASGGAAHLHMSPQQPDGWQPGLGSVFKPAASHSKPAAEGLDDGLDRLDALIAAEEAGSSTAPSKSPSKTPARALRRGFLGPASRQDTKKMPAKETVKQPPPMAEEVQPLAEVRERAAAAEAQQPEPPSAANSRRMSKFKQLRMVNEQ